MCTGGLIDGGNTILFLGKIGGSDTTLLYSAGQWWDGTLATCLVGHKILTHAEIKHYTNVGIHNDYTLAVTVIGTNRYYRMEYNRKQ